jgi:hypothetical protein
MTDKTLSRQPRLAETKDILAWTWTMWEQVDDMPVWGAMGRAAKLREYGRAEPILSGARASMLSKAVSLNWQITGGRNRVKRYQPTLAEAEDGAGWTYFLDRYLADFVDTDLGGIAELGREGENGPVGGIYNLDAAQCWLTGNVEYPLRYSPSLAGSGGGLSGKSVPLRPTDFARIVDLPSADETKHGLGFCAVSRALKAAKVLMALYHYEDEKLSDMPLPGLISITGLTMPELQEAFKLYEAKRLSKEQVTFKGLLWLASQMSPLNPIDAKLLSFASLPEGFDKEQTITLYVYTLALDFGVDVREFWPASQTGATKAEAEVQAQKAKGKGFGRILMSVERAINWNVLPPGLEFAFDQKDSEDDLMREAIREKVITNVRKMWEPPVGGLVTQDPSTGEEYAGLISRTEARRLLVEAQVVPEWLAPTEDVTLEGAANVDKAVDRRIAEKAARADLDPGEDLVAINAQGDVVTLWSARYYSLPVANWPGLEVPAARPLRSLTTP